MLSYGGAAIALIMTGPSVLFGAIARATDWEKTEYPCGKPTDTVRPTKINMYIIIIKLLFHTQ